MDDRQIHTGRRRVNILIALSMITFAVSFIDRSVINILAERIRIEFALSDTQLGVLTSLAFVIFYSLAGFPIAYYVDRPSTSRPRVIAICMALWSSMTMLTAFAFSYLQLLITRSLVAVGEAGASPAIMGLLHEQVPVGQRSRAFALCGMGIPIGTLIGLMLGGWLVDILGWRTTLLLVGFPGFLLAAVIVLAVRESRPGGEQSAVTPLARERVGFRGNLGVFRASTALRWLTAGMTLAATIAAGLQAWAGVYLIRTMHLSAAHAGLILGLSAGLGGGLGTYLGGAIGDRLAVEDFRRSLIVPTLGLLIGIPAVAAALCSADWRVFAAFYWITICGASAYFGPSFSLLQRLSPERFRATTTILVTIIMNLIGGGLIPSLVGVISDGLSPHLGAESLRYALGFAHLLAIIPALIYLKLRYTGQQAFV